MNVLYCNLGGSGNKTLHVDDLPTLGQVNHEAHHAADLHRIIDDSGATQVSFDFGFMPRKAVSVNNAKLASLIDKLVRRMSAKVVAR